MSALVAAVDISLASTGVAVSTGLLTRVRSKGARDDSLASRAARLERILGQVLDLTVGAELVVIEQPAYGMKGGSIHDRSGLWWLAVHYLGAAGSTVVEVSPTARAKYACGKGNASKDDVLATTVRRYTDWAVDGNDVADALVLLAMALDAGGRPLVEVPKLNREALAKVAWPVLAVAP